MNYLFENWRNFLEEARVDDVIKKYPGHEKVIRYFSENDPAGNDKYLRWMTKQYIENQKNPEAIATVTKGFHKNRQRLDKKDIYQWDFDNLVDTLNSLGMTNKEKSEAARKDAIVIHEDKEFFILMPTSVQSSCKYGSGTKWCISGEYAKQHLYHYAISDHKAITFIIDKNRDKKDRLYKIAVLLDLHEGEFVEIRDALDELLVGDEDGIMMLDDYHDDILNFLQNFIGEDLTEKVYKAMQRYGETQHDRISESHKSKTEISLASWNKIQAVVQKINSEIVDVILESYHFGKDSSEILSFRDLHREMKENWEDYANPTEDEAEVSLQFRIKPIRFIALEPSHCISSMLKQSLKGDSGGIFDSIDLNWRVLGEQITIGDILKSRFTDRSLHDYFDQYPSGWTLNKIGMGNDHETRLSLKALAGALSFRATQQSQRYIKSQMNKPEQFRVLYSSTPHEVNTSKDYVVLTIREGGDIEDIATAIIESYKYITDALESDSLGRHFVEFI